ncbi:MAG: zinc-ribbon domain-containing protein [Lachnospiraceae bacterium]|nr:zinc-ribbon domain-containing protein [Lachnospiraceae bacterium]
MFCTKCGNKILDGALFCTKCGNRVSQGTAGMPKQNNVK